MRFFEVVLSGAALLAAVEALSFTSVPDNVEAGETYTITYEPADDTPTTIILRQGDPDDLDTISTLTTTATGGTFEWTVDSALADANDYALEIEQEGVDPNFSDLITLSGGSAQSSGSATPSATSASETASSSGSATTTADSTLITTATSASASISSSIGLNSTISSATLSSTASRGDSTSTPTSSGGPPEETNAASVLGSSPLALIFGAVAAMAYLN